MSSERIDRAGETGSPEDPTVPPEETRSSKYPDIPTVKVLHQHDGQCDPGGGSGATSVAKSAPPER